MKCRCCDQEIDWPPLDYGVAAPWRDFIASEEDFDKQVRLKPDYCVIRDEIFFLRCNVMIPVIDSTETFAWGVWCSVSAKSFDRIMELWDSPTQADEPPFFGWLMTVLPGYSEPTMHAKSSIQLQGPAVVPQVHVIPDHPLGQEQLSGITWARVEEFARLILGDTPPVCPSHQGKP
jgi:hypothetical protein